MSSVTTFFVDELARLVKASGVDTHIGTVQTPVFTTGMYPYVLLVPPLHVLHSVALDDAPRELSTAVQVTVVESTSANLIHTADHVANTLSGATLDVDGYRVAPLKVAPLYPMRADRTVTITDTNTHPITIGFEVLITATRKERP
ncbi:hypothetical protein [Actinomyces sp.]|uniref:hypothetical protein n=1 Tax=Actinomyces sp. TaxID=29317 RepID=UPI002910801C|nr:hypothetical protein [Actinomyces sp.]MDU7239802.1 hypothetical protein [Actinomyces sp.]